MAISFTQVEIKDFMAIGKARLRLNDQGLVLIQGNNEDDPSTVSNGSGKSSIADALCWCLYGDTARGMTGDNIIRNGAKSACVAVNIKDDDGSECRVVRYRKDKTHKNRLELFVDGNDVTKGTDKETQLLVNALLGCDRTVFSATIYQGQERMPDLPSMTDKNLKEVVEQAAGITELQNCQTLARSRLAAATTSRDQLNITVTQLKDVTIPKLEDTVSRLTRSKEDWDADNKAEIEKLAVDLAEKQDYLKMLIERSEKFDEKRPSLLAHIKKIKLSLDTSEWDRQRKAHSEKVWAAHSQLKEDGRDLKVAIERCKDEEYSLSNLDLIVGRPCGECGKPYLAEDLSDVRAAKRRLIEELALDKGLAEAKLAESEALHEKLLEEEAKFIKTKPDLTKAASALADAEVLMNAGDRLTHERETFEVTVETTRKRLDVARKRTNPMEKMLAEETEALKRARVSLAAAEKNLEQAQLQMEKQGKVVEVFSTSGVRAHILDHVTPFLNARTNYYLSTLSGGNLVAEWTTLVKTAKGDLREKFTIEVKNHKGGQAFGLLSGGEKRKVRLSCAMALQDVVAARASKSINLLLADEIDDALDEAGLELLMGLLEEKARERGTVLVISHRELRDWIREVIVVTKRGGEASIAGAASVVV